MRSGLSANGGRVGTEFRSRADSLVVFRFARYVDVAKK